MELHTSGHADLDTIKKVQEVLKPEKVITIHTENNAKAKEIFDNVIELHDNEVIEI